MEREYIKTPDSDFFSEEGIASDPDGLSDFLTTFHEVMRRWSMSADLQGIAIYYQCNTKRSLTSAVCR
jgi:hypothetical protein